MTVLNEKKVIYVDPFLINRLWKNHLNIPGRRLSVWKFCPYKTFIYVN